MKAMVLAAGYGKRMAPLTDTTPKPLLTVAGKPLLAYRIEELKAAGITQLVVNHGWLGEQIEAYFGDGSDFGVSIQWSREDTPMNTASGIANALPLLGGEPFIVVNGDVWSDYDFKHLAAFNLKDDWGHVVLVPNPEHNLDGDFGLQDTAVIQGNDWTFSGVSLLSPVLFSRMQNKTDVGLGVLLQDAITHKKLSGETFAGTWVDVGTPERLKQLNKVEKN